MPTPHQIQIRFIRQVRGSYAEPNPHRDDILTITRQGDNSLRLVYTERSEDDPVIDVMNYTHQQTMSYMYRVLWLLTMDNDPFASVQFFIPGYPTFLITTNSIMNNSSQLLDIIFSACLSWPTAGTRLDAARTSTHGILAQPGVSVQQQQQS